MYKYVSKYLGKSGVSRGYGGFSWRCFPSFAANKYTTYYRHINTAEVRGQDSLLTETSKLRSGHGTVHSAPQQLEKVDSIATFSWQMNQFALRHRVQRGGVEVASQNT